MIDKLEIETDPQSIYSHSETTIALLPWGDVWEDFFDSIGVSFETFCTEMTGGWQFGYIEALKLFGVNTVIIYPSTRVTKVTRFQHAPTGATICLLPVPLIYQKIRCQMIHPYPSLAYCEGLESLFGNVQGSRRILFKILQYLTPYLSTSLGHLIKEIRYANCKAIFCQEYECSRFDLAVLLGKLLNLPVFATFQGGNYDSNPIGQFLRPLTIKACRGLAIGTQTEIDRVYNQYLIQPAKVAKIFNPIDLKMWELIDRHHARTLFEIPTNAKVVVWHGRISIYTKGLDILLDAWEKISLRLEDQDLRLMLMGTGQDAEKVQQRIMTLPKQNVLWIDKYVNDRTFIRNYLSSGDVYAFPSRHEGFPVAPIEGMACGLPVVATTAPGVTDIFEGGEKSGGIIVPCEDTNAFTQALERILSNAELAEELGKSARSRVEQSFSLEAVGKQLKNFMI